MSKTSAKKKTARLAKEREPGGRTDVVGDGAVPSGCGSKASSARIGKARFDAVMKAAARSGLLSEKSRRIGGRVSPALVEQAKRLTGIESDTDLIEFALANVALQDRFAEVFKKSRGKVAGELKLGF